MAWRAMPLFGLDSGCPVTNPSAPFHADPVARALGPGANRKPTSLSPVGVAPVPSAPHHRSVAHQSPEGGLWTRFASPDRPSMPGCPVTTARPGRPPSPSTTRRWPWARSDPTTAPVSRDVRRPVVAVALRRARQPGPGWPWTLSMLRFRCASWAVWAGPKPPPHRPGRRALSGTSIS